MLPLQMILLSSCLPTNKEKDFRPFFHSFWPSKVNIPFGIWNIEQKTTWSLSSVWKFFLKCYPAKQIHYSSSLLINCTASLFYFKVTFVKNLMPKRIRCLFLKLWWEQDALRHPQLANKNYFSKACIWDFWHMVHLMFQFHKSWYKQIFTITMLCNVHTAHESIGIISSTLQKHIHGILDMV